MDNAVRDLESKREGAYAGLNQQLANLNLTHLQLQQTTSTLAEAMKSSTARGKWGELQLLRVIEMSGMKSHVDFE
ncbi:MAG TPA: DNA recombination protein RmuC, partial [Thermoflexales bacterium]|nr:DNA recombination protein RmuC [Thermoflexales bacterium]